MNVVVKESKNLGLLVIKEVDYDTTKKIMIERHYSHKWNTSFGKINVGIFKDDVLLGVASFGNLMNPKSYIKINKDFKQENVIELNRLWIDDCLGKNAETILLGACWKLIKNNHPEIKVIQSFADGRLGCGTIYKAASFKYFGYEKSLFYENIDTKETQHKVPMENTMRPNGMIKLNRLWCEGKLRPFYVKTYRYLFPLYKKTKIELKEEFYPEYDIGLEYLDAYMHDDNLVVRAMILAYILKQEDDFIVLEGALKDKYSEQDLLGLIESQINNKSIIRIAQERGLEEIYYGYVDWLSLMKLITN